MNEHKNLSEQELEQATGGVGSDGFESAWAAYTRTHCANCTRRDMGKETFCASEKLHAKRAYAAGQPLNCNARIVAP